MVYRGFPAFLDAQLGMNFRSDYTYFDNVLNSGAYSGRLYLAFYDPIIVLRSISLHHSVKRPLQNYVAKRVPIPILEALLFF